jgi:hypothetical protein
LSSLFETKKPKKQHARVSGGAAAAAAARCRRAIAQTFFDYFLYKKKLF